VKLINFGGATALLEHAGVRMLFDPWLDDGIFHGAWYHWPPLAAGIEEVGRVDYIYLSHIHEDHCSAGTLKHLDRGAEILVMDNPPNFVAKFLDTHGFGFKAVHRIKPRTPTVLRPGLEVTMLEADPANEMSALIDSALLLRWDGFHVYNANDCQPWPGGLEYARGHLGCVDLALVPYSGGSGYPSCYRNLDDAQKTAARERILASRLANFVRTVREIDPVRVMPFADQYVIAGSRGPLNRWVSHPSCPGVVEPHLREAGLGDRLLLLNSGQSFDFSTGSHVPDEPYRFFDDAARDAYVAGPLSDKRYDHERITFAPGIAIERLVQHARARLLEAQRRKGWRPDCTLYLDAEDLRRRFAIPLCADTAAEVPWDAPLDAPYLRVACSYTLLVMLLIGHVSWNIADAALFLDYERVPDTYDPEVYVCLNLLRT
jgi:UDP-MurNAc hydroxylase